MNTEKSTEKNSKLSSELRPKPKSESKSKSGSQKVAKTVTKAEVPTLQFEHELGYPRTLVIGIDEVGRGCIAGPVVAGAVLLPDDLGTEAEWFELRDSKLLTPVKREALAPWIQANVRGWGLGSASVAEIDQHNILKASWIAMERAVAELKRRLIVSEPRCEAALSGAKILVDGHLVPHAFKGVARAVVKGDMKSISIAAASIIAKVERDGLVTQFDTVYPGYGFAFHKGYGTANHLKALRARGVTPEHRRSFAPVAEVAGG